MNLSRCICYVCGEFTMLMAVKSDNVEHAQCGNNECKSNKPEANVKANIQKLLNTAVLNPKEVPDVLKFVAELIDLELLYDKKVHPQAKHSHGDSRIAYQVVKELEEFFNEHYNKNTL